MKQSPAITVIKISSFIGIAAALFLIGAVTHGKEKRT